MKLLGSPHAKGALALSTRRVLKNTVSQALSFGLAMAMDGVAAVLVARALGHRVGVRGGGCSDFTYFYDWGSPRHNDTVLEVAGLKVVVDPKSLKILEGTELDYESNLLAGGFKFKNPNAKKSCSCGDSFSV
jgi:iron-sulfur cluster assembly protein